MESNTCDGSVEAKAIKGFDSPVSIHVTSYRFRLCDIDGISVKATVDGLVHCGILQDDSPAFVKKVSIEQVKVKNKSEEKTVVTITESV